MFPVHLRSRLTLCFIVVILTFIVFVLPQITQAQTPPAANTSSVEGAAATLGVARIVEVTDKDVKDGALISSYDSGITLTNVAYDPQILGVVSRDAAIVLANQNSEDGVPVISTVTVYVLVSSKDGPLKKGDLLTSSTIPGVAVKAVKSGYVIGRALEDFDSNDKQEGVLIAAELDLHYFNAKPTLAGSLTDIFKIALLPTRDGPTPIFKYIAAAAVILGSFVLGFLSFGRTAAKGVEALGRNPAASKIIHLGIIFNVGIVVVIVLSGMVVAFLILRL